MSVQRIWFGFATQNRILTSALGFSSKFKGIMKKNVKFKSKGTTCAAWLFQPEGDGPFPVVVMAHGLAGIKEMRLGAYAEKFCEAGFTCLVFDYRYFGESDGEPRQLLDISKQHEDWIAAVDYVRQLPQIDPTKVVLWGSSLSGGHVLKIASLIPSVTAVIAQVPHLNGFELLRMSSLSKSLALTLHGIYDKVCSLFGLAPHYILASSEPEKLSLMNAPGESAGYLNLVPDGRDFDSRVSARFALYVSMYSPIRQLRTLKMPVLIQVCTSDLTTPAKPAIDECPKLSNVQLKQYDTGHFQPYVEPMFSVVVADQLAFLKEKVKP